MTIEFKVGEMYINGKRVIFPRDAGFQNAAVLFATDYVNGTFVPISCTPDGTLGGSSNFLFKNSPSFDSSAWVDSGLNFTTSNILIYNDESVADNDFSISFDIGTTTHAVVKAGEQLELKGLSKSTLHVTAAAGKTISLYRLLCW